MEKASLLCCLMFTQKSYSIFGSVHFLDTYNNSMIVCVEFAYHAQFFMYFVTFATSTMHFIENRLL